MRPLVRRLSVEDAPLDIRQVKYLNDIAEQDQKAVKRVTRPMLGFKSFAAVQEPLAGVELMPMLKKGQRVAEEEGLTPAEPIPLEHLHPQICYIYGPADDVK